MPKKRISNKAFNRLMLSVKRINMILIDQWHIDWDDNKFNEKDIKKPDKDVQALILETHINWLIEDYIKLHKNNQKKIDQLFAAIYYQIEGKNYKEDL